MNVLKRASGILLCATALLISGTACGQDSTGNTAAYTLQQCVELAIKNNPDVTQAGFQAQSDRINWQQQRAAMLPTLNGGISHSIYNGRSIDPYSNSYVTQQYNAASYQLNAGLTLWNGSSIQHFIRQYRLAYEASEMDLQQAKDRLTIDVILNYLSVLTINEQLEMAKGQAEVTRRQVERLTIQNREGAISPSDLYKMKGQLGSDELNIVNTENMLEGEKLTLAQLMNIPYSRDMKLEKLAINPAPLAYDATVEEISRNALQNLALVKAADLREQSARNGVKAARGQLLPTLSLSAGVYTNYSSAATTSELMGISDKATDQYVTVNNTKIPVFAPEPQYNSLKIPYGNQWKNNVNTNVSLNLQIPLLNGLQARNRVKQAKISRDQAAFAEKTTRIQLRQAIEQDYLNMRSAFESYKKLADQVQNYTESFRGAEVKFNAGAITSVDYVIAKNDLDNARLNMIAAKYKYALQTKILDYYRGKLSW
ncbi:TolC family protein [Compostibacter hankyongensis]|uniref:TolC family protein n=1 Tax=Compostibacter hankyongensis TaxID=1007089 RepID=A0ABP8FM79_9BACT